MAGRRDNPEAPARVTAAPEVVEYLVTYLKRPEPGFLLITGAVGAGKSSILRELVARFPGPKVYLAYQSPSPPPGTGSSAPPPSIPFLIVDPGADVSDTGAPPRADRVSSMLAFSPQEAGEDLEIPPPLARAMARLGASEQAMIVVDSWDRASEAFFRAQAKGAGSVETFSAPPSAIAALQLGIPSSPTRLVLVVTPELGHPLRTVADAVVDLHDEPHAEGPVRVISIAKVRGTPPPESQQLYSLQDGRFRSMPGFAPGFRPPVGPPDPDPSPQSDSGWPGSTAFADAFGRFRYGGVTGLTLSADIPDSVPPCLTVPAVLHALKSGGRVAWIPAPSMRPAKIVSLLGRFVSPEWIRERVRIVSASGEDAGPGVLHPTRVSAERDGAGAPDLPRGIAPATGPLIRDVYRFLRDRPASTPALYVVSISGLRAALTSVGMPLPADTLPVVLGFYTRLPQIHLFGYADADDAVAPQMRPAVDTLLHLEMIHGRPILFGIRPKRAPLLLDWIDGEGRYSLVPVA
jgi:hypothetical protein